jgi:squalene-hopene/tetraprenyl-beta-curcumene cyclase
VYRDAGAIGLHWNVIMSEIDAKTLKTAYEKARDDLLSERTASGHWIGRLSSSALSTATAISALAIASRATDNGSPSNSNMSDKAMIEAGLAYLAKHQNPDGGWGDTDLSYSNVATTMLGIAAIRLADRHVEMAQAVSCAEAYVDAQGRVAALRQRYGKDKTFAVPILTNTALAGGCDWSEVAALPFELACVPQRLYRFMRMPVVSYAIPALVAIGQARHFHRPPRFAPLRWLRSAAAGRSLTVLRRMQPTSGGYLEAVPLTSFVAMSLASIGRIDDPVTQDGLRFIRDSFRADGSWPIDTNLATWNTTLAINALANGGEDVAELGILNWLLDCQQRTEHPYTGAAPGGWGWSDLSGSVPDADDTPGALLALHAWRKSPSVDNNEVERIVDSASAGLRWLMSLQNSDGGWPTFCRGWGKLPFDRSGVDLTAHALRALHAWRDLPVRGRDAAMARGLAFMQNAQREDGSWVPLWFGNQDHPAEENAVYGTAKVLHALRDLGKHETSAWERGLHWLASVQNADGGWGCGLAPPESAGESKSSVEETSLAVEALLASGRRGTLHAPANRGLKWLVEAVGEDRNRASSPIGFYFAKLWYYEKLYPMIFAVAALGRATRDDNH